MGEKRTRGKDAIMDIYKCLEIKIAEGHSLCIKLAEPYEGLLLEMFPQGSITYRVPNISYEKGKTGVKFFADDESIQFVEQDNFFDIMFIIEEYVQKKYNSIVLHGGAIVKNDKAIVIIQSRKRGKTTLLRGLLADNKCFYVSDDVLLLNKDKIAGIAAPMRVREKLEDIIKCNGKYIGSMMDESGEQRNIFVPNNLISERFMKISCIILPSYSNNGENYFIELSGIQKFIKVLENVKEYKNIQHVYREISYLCNFISVYEIHYSDIGFAIEKINALSNMGFI